MNKYQDSLYKIENIVLNKNNDGYWKPRTVHDFYYSQCEDIRELVEKETPKKILYNSQCFKDNDEKDWAICPSCGYYITDDPIYDLGKYCPNCGQRIDLGEDE